jgi:hypothetical protein
VAGERYPLPPPPDGILVWRGVSQSIANPFLTIDLLQHRMDIDIRVLRRRKNKKKKKDVY